MSRPYGVPSPFRHLRAEEIPEAEEEPPLRIRDYALTYLYAFDLGSAWPGIRIEPGKVVERLVDLGYAIANTAYVKEIGRVGIRWKEHFMVRYLADKVGVGLGPIHSPRDLLEALKRIEEAAVGRGLNPEELRKEAGEKFAKDVGLLEIFEGWDGGQIPTYVKQGRSARALFPTFGMKMPHDDRPRPAQMIASIHSGGVGCLSLHLGPARKGLSVDEAMDLLEDHKVMPVEVEFPRELEEVIGSCRARWKLSEGWRHKGGMGYEATLNDAFVVFMHAVYMAALDALGMGKGDPSNYRRLHEAGAFAYPMLYILAGEGRIEEPFKEVVMRHPRQCHGLLARDRYRKWGAECVANGFIDISPSVVSSWAFHGSAMLTILADDLWEGLLGGPGAGTMAVPRSIDMVCDAARFELLSCLRMIHRGYDLLLTRVMEEGDLEGLIGAEERVARGLEEVYQARHQIFGSVADWWWLAEERLRISELNRAISEKLGRVHQIIATKEADRLNRRLIGLTIALVALTAALAVLMFIPEAARVAFIKWAWAIMATHSSASIAAAILLAAALLCLSPLRKRIRAIASRAHGLAREGIRGLIRRRGSSAP